MSLLPPFDTDDPFRAWLARDANVRPPDALLVQVLTTTARRRPRPAWLVIERWFPMETTARFGAVPRTLMIAILLVLALLATSLAVVGVGAQPSTVPSVAPGVGAFAPGPALGVARVMPRATELSDGRLLVTGGYGEDSRPLSTAELFDPATATFEPAGSLAAQREFHSSTLLDDGRVLLVGGRHSDTGELWDPRTLSSEIAAPLIGYRANHTATGIGDGRVLIVGGYEGPGEAEVWDPATGTFRAAGTLAHARGHHMAALLQDGRVLIVGGPTAAEIWDPRTDTFGPAGTAAAARWWGTVTLLGDGRVLVVGGGAGEAFGEGDAPVAAAEVWDPATMTFSPAGTLLEPRFWHTATLLPDGRVLVVGGISKGGTETPSSSAELWDPVTASFTPAASLIAARGGHAATLLPDGRVLVIGGNGEGEGSLASTEVWDPLGAPGA